jgi:hypothetical protein
MRQSLPGIKRIAYIATDLLPDDITLKAIAGIPVNITGTATEIDVIGEANCETDSEPDNNSQLEKVDLKFNTLDDIPTDSPLAFIVETVSGNKYVIGTKERPYPIVKISTATGTPDGNPSVRKVEVTYKAKRPLVPYTM